LDLSLPVRSDSIVKICRYYRWITGHRTHRFSRWNCVIVILYTSGDTNTSGLAAAILDLKLLVRSDTTLGITVGLLEPENMRLAVGISLLLCVQQDFPRAEVVTLFTNENGTPSDFSPVVPVVS